MRRTAQQGFTLAELILVMLLLVLIVGVVAPRFSGSLPGAKLNKATSDLHAVIQKVRADAVILVRLHRLNIDPGDQNHPGTFWVEVEEDPLRNPGVFSQPTKGPLRHVFDLPEDVIFYSVEGAGPSDSGTGDVFTFRPDGTVEDGTIVLALGTDGPSRTLTLNGATSNVEVSE